MHTPATWQASEAAHTTGLAPTHAPAWQVSLCVQLSLSLHAVPFAAFGLLHTPVAALHTPATWQASEAAHTTGFAPTQAPAWQVSLCVQALLSLHALPLAAFGLLHTPVAALHTPARWHASEATHTTGLAPTQAPAWQVSLWVHALLSLHAVPLAAFGLVHTPVAGLHTPTP